ncbi:murein transglycosylase [Shewanella canadensis]|uniref:Murein transglycosylase n=1 Tax=Shewanella canadensis TaxID=271096 RepID=A0A431WMF4_9GAMM|nr:transglycosylase SLT domain-containing protein [Shewanella canadensis]RTR36918.1 murein transglycosylase [Shewanella canadensis]
MNLRFACLIGCTLLLSQSALASDSFTELDAEIEKAGKPPVEGQDREYSDFVFAYMAEYENWRVEYLQEFDQYRAEIIAIWGTGEVSQQQKSVEYSADKNVKSVVDYEANELTVSIIVDKDLTDDEIKQKLNSEVKSLVENKKSNIFSLVTAEDLVERGQLQSSPVSFSDSNEQQAKSVIIEQTKAQLSEIDKELDKAQLTKLDSISMDVIERVSDQKKNKLVDLAKERLVKLDAAYEERRESAKQAELTEKKVIQYRVSLPKNGLSVRAAKVVDFAQKEGLRWQVPSALIMAVIHSESSFDPKARSPIPAYGLMQIVPTSAGFDVNQIVRKINEPMSSSELYLPMVNVETGAAYLNILDKRYLKSIINEKSRMYCTIAAYNTGAGNVAKAFNSDGARNIRKASKVINQMEPDEVYQHLLQNLPYEETKHYLEKVSGRISLYQNKI